MSKNPPRGEHVPTLDSQIAELKQSLEDLRRDAQRGPRQYAAATQARAIVVERLAKLQREKARMAIALAMHDTGNVAPPVGWLQFSLYLGAILSVVVGLAILLAVRG